MEASKSGDESRYSPLIIHHDVRQSLQRRHQNIIDQRSDGLQHTQQRDHGSGHASLAQRRGHTRQRGSHTSSRVRQGTEMSTQATEHPLGILAPKTPLELVPLPLNSINSLNTLIAEIEDTRNHRVILKNAVSLIPAGEINPHFLSEITGGEKLNKALQLRISNINLIRNATKNLRGRIKRGVENSFANTRPRRTNISQRATESVTGLQRLPADGFIHRLLQILKRNLPLGGHLLDFLSRLAHRLGQRLSYWNSVFFQLHERIAHDLTPVNRLRVNRRNIGETLISERRGIANSLKNPG